MNKYQWAEESPQQTADDRVIVVKKVVEQEDRFTLGNRKRQLEDLKKRVVELEAEIAEVETELKVK